MRVAQSLPPRNQNNVPVLTKQNGGMDSIFLFSKISMTFHIVIYYVDMALDLSVALEFYRRGYHGWSTTIIAVLILFTVFQVLGTHRSEKKGGLARFFQTSPVFLLLYKASRESRDMKTSESIIDQIVHQGLFQAPLQVK